MTSPLRLIAFLALATAARLDGQRLRPVEFPTFHPSLLMLQQPDTSPKPEHVQGDNYTWEGVALGAIVVGVLGVKLSGMCGMSDQPGRCDGAALTGLLAGATVGAVLGGIIGSGIEKSP
jgi:hypothetical protein